MTNENDKPINSTPNAPAKVDTPKPINEVSTVGDHDRVAMLSLKADGTPDQNNPEIIGDKETAVEAAKTQFAQQAVSAVDTEKRAEAAYEKAEEGAQDPFIADLKEAHDSAAEAAEKRAEETVESLHK